MRAFVRWRAQVLGRPVASILGFACLALPPAGVAEALRDLPATRLRIRLAQHGIYELSRADLLTAGVPVGDPAFDPRNLRLEPTHE